jgi:hypothetical protein
MDPEIQAMGEIARALETLEPDAARRVLKWAIERFQVSLSSGPKEASPAGRPEDASLPTRAFLDFPELFDAANPQTGLDKALVAAYWYQIVQGQDDWDSQTTNKELKNLGHPSSNITRDLEALIKRTPRLVMQVRKQGSTRQARKRYKLTREGIRAVEAMLNASAQPMGVGQ